MAAKYVTVKELLDSGRILLPDLLQAFENGKLRAFSKRGQVKFLSCPEDCPDFNETAAFDKWGQWKPDDAEKAEHGEMVKWENFLSKMWDRNIVRGKRIVPHFGPFPENPDFFPCPLNEETARALGLPAEWHEKELMSMQVPAEEIDALFSSPNPLSGREEMTYLKIMRGLMLALKIDPNDRKVVSRLKNVLELQGVEIDDETIRGRIGKMKNINWD